MIKGEEVKGRGGSDALCDAPFLLGWDGKRKCNEMDFDGAVRRERKKKRKS